MELTSDQPPPMSDRGHPHQWPVVAPRRPEPRAEMPGGAETPAAVSSQSSHSSVSLQSSVLHCLVFSGNAEVTCCSMTVRPLPSHTRYWGPSQTFVTKTGGVKYITDQVRGNILKVDIST